MTQWNDQPDITAGCARLDDEIRWAQEELASAGVASARADAEWLAAWVLDVSRGQLLMIDELEGDDRVRFREAVALRSRRIPLQHIVGRAAFGPVDLSVGPGVFIPRPETEYLLEWAVNQFNAGGGDPASPGPVIADLCSGSGALAIGLATLLPEARVVAVEKSQDALIWLRRNIAEQPDDVADRITVVAADVTDPVAMRAQCPSHAFDLVVSNPPYVPTSSQVSDEVRHDPHSAVFGGADGMSVIIPMLDVIAEMLRTGGLVGIEHYDTTAPLVVDALTTAGFDAVAAHTDLTGRPRFVTGRMRVWTGEHRIRLQ